MHLIIYNYEQQTLCSKFLVYNFSLEKIPKFHQRLQCILFEKGCRVKLTKPQLKMNDKFWVFHSVNSSYQHNLYQN